MNFQDPVHAVMRNQRKNDNLTDMFAAVRINDFVVGQLNDKCAFGSDCLSGRAEFFGQVVPTDRLCGKSRGQLSGNGADTDGSVLFFFPDPSQRTPQQLDNF